MSPVSFVYFLNLTSLPPTPRANSFTYVGRIESLDWHGYWHLDELELLRPEKEE